MTRSLKSADGLSAIMASAVLHEDSFKLSLSGQLPSTFCRSASHVLASCTAGSIAFLKTASNASAVASVLLRLPATAPQPPSGFWPSNKRFSDSSNTTSAHGDWSLFRLTQLLVDNRRKRLHRLGSGDLATINEKCRCARQTKLRPFRQIFLHETLKFAAGKTLIE